MDLNSRVRDILWRIRLLLGCGARSDSELQYRLNRLPNLTTVPGKFEFPWGEMEYVSTSDLRGQFSEIFVRRHYAFRSSVTDPVIVDAGGNIGLSSIWFMKTYPKAKLTVYEADPELTSLLSRNLASAQISDVMVQNAAVWISDGLVAFDNRGQDKGMVNPTGAIKVPSVDLAKHLPERVDLLKLDVEGAEYALIERLCETGVISQVRNIVAEFHIKREDMDCALSSLRRLRESGMQVSVTSEIGPWLGDAASESPFEIVGKKQILAEVYAWR